MSRPTHSFSWLRGQIHTDQLATGTATSGYIPVSTGTTQVWTDPATLGISGDLTYVHIQTIAATTWTVTHGLGKYPAVSVVDSGLTLVLGTVTYLDANTVQLDFSAAFSGKAYCN